MTDEEGFGQLLARAGCQGVHGTDQAAPKPSTAPAMITSGASYAAEGRAVGFVPT